MTKHFLGLIASASLSLLAMSASAEFCLSGGFSSGYSCDFEKAAGNRPSVYSIQLLAQNGREQSLGQRLQKNLLTQTAVSGTQSLYYFGELKSVSEGWQALKQVKRVLGGDADRHKPMLVSYTASDNALPRIRLVEPIEEIQAAELTVKEVEVTAAAVTKAETDSSVQKRVVGPVYSIQLVAFSALEGRTQFLKRYSDFELYCRRHDNGLYISYLGMFHSRREASEYLANIQTFDYLKPYVVKFHNEKLPLCYKVIS